MRKFIVAGLLAASLLTSQCFAITTGYTIAASGTTNISLLFGGSGELLSAIVASQTPNVGASLSFYDSNTGSTNIVATYTTQSQYASNCISVWTNYYGYTNTVTNLSLYTVTNTVARVTNTLTPVFTLAAGTNSSVQYDNLNARFMRGVVIVNNNAASTSLTITYSQP